MQSSTVIGLAEYVKLDPSTKTATLRYGTTPFPVYYAFLWSSSILLGSLALTSAVLNKPLRDEFLMLDKRHSDLWDKYVQRR